VAAACPCCGDGTLRMIGEDVAEALELIPGDPARAREVVLPGLRSDYAAAGAIASDRARACRPEAARLCPLFQIQPAPAAQAPERNIRPRRRGSRRVDARRLGGRTGRLWTYVREDRPLPGPIHQRRSAQIFDLAKINKAPTQSGRSNASMYCSPSSARSMVSLRRAPPCVMRGLGEDIGV
jgi:hypothetical protein